MARQTLLIVLSAPSGGGKRTVLRKLWEKGIGFEVAVSATTRPPREGEREGHEYYFLSTEDFERRITEDAFVEYARVHDHLYGTLRSEVDRLHAPARDLVLELDVQGMQRLRALGEDLVSVFIMPPSREELERRLRGRGTDSEEVIAVRMRNAKNEIAARGDYDYGIVNDDVDCAADDLAAILRAEHCRAHRQMQE